MTKPIHSSSFLSRVDGAAFWEAWVGSVLSRAGLYTLHMPWTLAVSEEQQRRMFMQEVDLKVSATPMRHPVHVFVEVKSQKQSFTSPADYPYERPLVCSQNSWIRKNESTEHTGTDYLYVSQPTGSIIWLPKGSPVELGHEVLDHSRNELYKAVRTWKECFRDLRGFVEYVEEQTGKAAVSSGQDYRTLY